MIKTYVTRTRLVSTMNITKGGPYRFYAVAKVGFTDLQIGDVVDLHGAVEITSSKSYAVQFARAIKVAGADSSPDLARGEIVCRPMCGANIINTPGHHAVLEPSGFYTVKRNGSEASPHVFVLVSYVASTAAKSGDKVVVDYVELHVKVTKKDA